MKHIAIQRMKQCVMVLILCMNFSLCACLTSPSSSSLSQTKPLTQTPEFRLSQMITNPQAPSTPTLTLALNCRPERTIIDQTATSNTANAIPFISLQMFEDTVYITCQGKNFHRIDCPYLIREKIPIQRFSVIQDYMPCKTCKP